MPSRSRAKSPPQTTSNRGPGAQAPTSATPDLGLPSPGLDLPCPPAPVMMPLYGVSLTPNDACPPAPKMALLYGVAMPKDPSALAPDAPCPEVPLMTGPPGPDMEPPVVQPVYGVAMPGGGPTPEFAGPSVQPVYGISMPSGGSTTPTPAKPPKSPSG